MKSHKQRRRDRGGFTLIEILLVVAIIAMLASLVAVNIPKYIKSSRISAAKGQISNFDTGINAFLLEHGKYPPTLDALTIGDEPVMATLPLDPWQNPYRYVYPGRHPPFKYDISSFGPDGIENTDDDIANWKVDNAAGMAGSATR
ncbi:MAG: type II secretion system protein GspG [Kiritimatiellaeota bacterium]|nr:type II secretion system protein GspG [Kiritimatiellota bacterium]